MSETVHRDGNLLYTLMGTGQYRRGEEGQKNCVAVHFTFDASVLPEECEAVIAAVQSALEATPQIDTSPITPEEEAWAEKLVRDGR